VIGWSVVIRPEVVFGYCVREKPPDIECVEALNATTGVDDGLSKRPTRIAFFSSFGQHPGVVRHAD
jgi:hypothetical protein